MNLPWTLEQAAFAANHYQNNHNITVLAQALNRTERSIVAKLTQLGLYSATPKKAREPTKAELVGELCEVMGLDPTVVFTLLDCSKPCLQEILRAARAP